MKKIKKDTVLESLNKHAFQDTGMSPVSKILNDPEVAATEDPAEFGHKVFVKMLLHLNQEIKKHTGEK